MSAKGSNSEVRARNSAVRFTLKNRRRQPGLSGPKSARTRPSTAHQEIASNVIQSCDQDVILNFHARTGRPRNNRLGRASMPMLPAERCPPTAGGKPVSFGLAAPTGGRLNSDDHGIAVEVRQKSAASDMGHFRIWARAVVRSALTQWPDIIRPLPQVRRVPVSDVFKLEASESPSSLLSSWGTPFWESHFARDLQ